MFNFIPSNLYFAAFLVTAIVINFIFIFTGNEHGETVLPTPSFSSSPKHFFEVTSSQTPVPFKKPPKCKISEYRVVNNHLMLYAHNIYTHYWGNVLFQLFHHCATLIRCHGTNGNAWSGVYNQLSIHKVFVNVRNIV